VQSPVKSILPTGEALFLSDHEPRPASAPAVTPDAAPPARPNTAGAKRKAERRAVVRKSRLRGKPAAGLASAVSEVLVFDAHDGDRDRLCNVSQEFSTWIRSSRPSIMETYVTKRIQLLFGGHLRLNFQ
jgi:hypothetical protein